MVKNLQPTEFFFGFYYYYGESMEFCLYIWIVIVFHYCVHTTADRYISLQNHEMIIKYSLTVVETA